MEIVKEKKALKKQSVGFVILKNLHYNKDKQLWTDGKINSPNSSKTYHAEATINLEETLELKCYTKIKFLGTKK